MSFSLAHEAGVVCSIYDLRGRLVDQVELGHLPAGDHQAFWDARDGSGRAVAAGVYLLSLERDGRRLGARRVTVVR